MSLSTRLPAAASLLLASILLSPAASQERYSSDDYRAVGRALVCQCGGCRALVHDCAMDRCPSSEPIREEIAERLQAGETAGEILARFRDRYGLHILAAPPTSGFHLSAWVLPFAALFAGGLAAVFVLRRWKRESGDGRSPAAAEVPEDLAARIERDVARIR